MLPAQTAVVVVQLVQIERIYVLFWIHQTETAGSSTVNKISETNPMPARMLILLPPSQLSSAKKTKINLFIWSNFISINHRNSKQTASTILTYSTRTADLDRTTCGAEPKMATPPIWRSEWHHLNQRARRRRSPCNRSWGSFWTWMFEELRKDNEHFSICIYEQCCHLSKSSLLCSIVTHRPHLLNFTDPSNLS